jgi:entericidin A
MTFTGECGFIHGAGRRLAPRSNPFDQEIPMKRILSLAVLALFSLNFLVACNTMKGAGQDVQKVGEKVEQKADDTGATTPN